MSAPEAVFKIIEENNCPLYELGDEFVLSGKALLLNSNNERTFITTSVIKIPGDKPTCRIIIEAMTSVLIKYESMSSVNRCVTNCSGCSGKIRIEYKRREKKASAAAGKVVKGKEEDVSALVSLLYLFPIFQTLEDHEIQQLVPLLKLKKFPSGQVIMKKGDPGSNLYIVISGTVEALLEDGTTLRAMERGEVFGEISLLIGTPVGATIKVVKSARLLYITGKDFRNALNMFPSLQMYFARLMAERLAKTNDERFEEFASGMVGKLQDISPAELLQTLNLNSKSGVLTLALPKGAAKVTFVEGALVGAEYNNKLGKNAFFELLKEKTGRFKFTPGIPDEAKNATEIGDFMWLLMEGIRRADETAAEQN